LNKAEFWSKHKDASFNERQRLMLNRLLDGFEGKLTSTKWATIAKCSQDTASRDVEALIQLGILQKDAGGGRNTSYSLANLN
jgi:Fic family protein